MSEAAFLVLLQTLVTLFPPFAELLARFLPANDAEPLISKIRSILPVEGRSAEAVRKLELKEFGLVDPLDEDDGP